MPSSVVVNLPGLATVALAIEGLVALIHWW